MPVRRQRTRSAVVSSISMLFPCRVIPNIMYFTLPSPHGGRNSAMEVSSKAWHGQSKYFAKLFNDNSCTNNSSLSNLQAIYGDKTELLKRESMGVSNFLTSIFANVSNILNHFHNRSLLRTWWVYLRKNTSRVFSLRKDINWKRHPCLSS